MGKPHRQQKNKKIFLHTKSAKQMLTQVGGHVKKSKPYYVLLLTGILGLSGGYFTAPQVLSYFNELYRLRLSGNDAPPPPTTIVIEEQDDEGATPATPQKPDDTTVAVTPQPDDEEEIDDSDIVDPESFADSDEEMEDDDPNGDIVTPSSITKYRRNQTPDEAEALRKPFKEQTYTGKTSIGNWKNPKALKRRLGSKLRSSLKNTDQKNVENFLLDPEMRLAMAQWELLHRSNLENLGKLMRDRNACKALEPLLNDLEWVSGFVYDGELQNAEIALGMIAHFAQVDENMFKDTAQDGEEASPWLKRRVAGAIATQFTRNGWYGEEKELTKEELDNMRELGYFMPTLPGDKKRGKNKQDVYRAARERYLYFAESIDKGLLHSKFATLPTWQLHYVCGWKGNSPFGTASTMRWLRDNCAAPAHAYVGMCRQVPYLPTNVYGDSIHSEWYYQPFDVLYPGNFAKETRDVGAVCGGLSHFGASSACANGVPAITMGEPGHCAYAVYFDGSWHPANSLNPEDKRSPHYSIWGEYTWKALQAQEDMYSQGAITRDAQMVVTLASVMAEYRNPNNALKLYELAVQMQPLYRPVWDMYLQTATVTLGRRPRRWLGVNEFVCTSIAGENPKSCADLLIDKIYPGMLKALRSPKQKLAAYEMYFKQLNANEKGQWAFNRLLDMQYQSLGKALAYKEDYMQILVNCVAEKPEFCQMLAWAIKTAAQENKAMHRKVLAMIDLAVAANPDNKQLLSCGVIRGAEETGDIELANKWSKDYLGGGGSLPAFEPVGGNLVSAGGLLTLTSYDDDQSIITSHGAALTETGGSVISSPSNAEHVVLQLQKKVNIGGIVLVAGGGTLSRRGYLVIEYSTDGKTWKHLAELTLEDSAKNMMRLNITRNHPSAKFIRITDKAISGEAQINLKAILVYDNKKVK